jgi:hypothetical protein
MRRFDKDKNIQKANLLAEQRYLESKGLIKEGEINTKQVDFDKLRTLDYAEFLKALDYLDDNQTIKPQFSFDEVNAKKFYIEKLTLDKRSPSHIASIMWSDNENNPLIWKEIPNGCEKVDASKPKPTPTHTFSPKFSTLTRISDDIIGAIHSDNESAFLELIKNNIDDDKKGKISDEELKKIFNELKLEKNEHRAFILRLIDRLLGPYITTEK